MSSLPALPATQTDYRAYELMTELPAGCLSVPVSDERGWPHLRLGEFAVVDPDDREPRSGEVYLVQWENGTRELASIKWRTGYGIEAWWIGAPAHPWRKPGTAPLSDAEKIKIAMTYGCIDGPITDRDYLRSKLVGRVVGILGATAEGPMRDVTPANGGDH